MAGTTESSVMFALSELQRIEGERIAEEAALEAERRRKEEERRRREREEQELAELHRLRVAEAEARLRVAEEGRLAEAAERAARLAAELETIQSERAALCERLSSIQLGQLGQVGQVGSTSVHGRRSRRGAWAAALLLCATVTAAAAGWGAQRAKAPAVVTVIKTIPAAAPAAVAGSDPADARRIAELEARLNKLLEKPRPRPQPSHSASASRPASGLGGAAAGSLVAQLSDCEKDPLCGVQISKREGGK